MVDARKKKISDDQVGSENVNSEKVHHGVDLVSERKPGNFVEYKADGDFNRRHILNIPRIKISVQRSNRQNLRFSVGHDIGFPAIKGPWGQYGVNACPILIFQILRSPLTITLSTL